MSESSISSCSSLSLLPPLPRGMGEKGREDPFFLLPPFLSSSSSPLPPLSAAGEERSQHLSSPRPPSHPTLLPFSFFPLLLRPLPLCKRREKTPPPSRNLHSRRGSRSNRAGKGKEEEGKESILGAVRESWRKDGLQGAPVVKNNFSSSQSIWH